MSHEDHFSYQKGKDDHDKDEEEDDYEQMLITQMNTLNSADLQEYLSTLDNNDLEALGFIQDKLGEHKA